MRTFLFYYTRSDVLLTKTLPSSTSHLSAPGTQLPIHQRVTQTACHQKGARILRNTLEVSPLSARDKFSVGVPGQPYAYLFSTSLIS